ncbi:MAG: glucose-1-phosphate adenylyltransferase subunit GlgD [Clostridiales Family XIII bacterium]|jgi:glucose-1-phosphate adenylyltransferase|nr:glucose-1-phosphate adenylyltransferase subunit GlgD [Clostridiales Family XIII bacterium]
MIREAFGMIYAGEQIINLRELVELRAVGALPIGGRYRVIDFPLSNMVNTGIRNVAVITNRNYNSLMDHLGSGKAWDLSRKSDGLFILTPYANRDNPGIYRGLVDALKGSMDYIRRAKQEYCILTGSYTIFNLVFDDMMRFHEENGSDLTILFNRLSAETYAGDRYADIRIKTDKKNVVTDIEVNPGLSSLDKVSMDTYIIRKDILIYLVEESIARGEYDFVRDLIRGNLGRLKVMGFEHKGYVGRMHSVAAYYKANMDFLDTKLQKTLFRGENRIFTKVKDEVPAKYIGASCVRNSIVANGCIIEGNVENSILFRGVYVGKGASVKNSILLPSTEVNDNAELQYVVIDKNVSVRNRSRLIGNEEFPVVIRKGAMV